MSANILVVDDSQVERLLVEGMLRKNPGYHVESAENGKEALEKIAAGPPDLVVTDLIMPEMDGLELVRTVRQRYPEVPVILMTAYGDELTAVEALEAGAASYVAKAQKAERLMATIHRVVEQAKADRSRVRLSQCMLEYHCRFALQNDRQLIRTLVGEVQQAMASIGFTDTVERIRIGEAIEEALLNAMYHGNLEVSGKELAKVWSELDEHLLDKLVLERCQEPHIRERRILVVVHVTTSEARFVIRDEGRGFDAMFAMADDKSNPLELARRRGVTLIRSLMDEVTYNKTGNELVMRKRTRGCTTDP
ncbi:MAG: response regulator [Pirellulales bacterium]